MKRKEPGIFPKRFQSRYRFRSSNRIAVPLLLIRFLFFAGTAVIISMSCFGSEISGRIEPTQDEAPQEKIPPARQNQILRDYFRSRYPGFRVENGIDSFVEDFVDRQIDFFLKTVDENLTDLKNAVEVLSNLRGRLVTSDQENSTAERDILRAFMGALKKVESEADDLRDLLSVVLMGLERKGKFQESITEGAKKNWYGAEIHYIQNQVRDAEKRIQEYLFDSSNVVDARDLKRESMMSCLFYAEQMAKAIRKEVERSR